MYAVFEIPDLYASGVIIKMIRLSRIEVTLQNNIYCIVVNHSLFCGSDKNELTQLINIISTYLSFDIIRQQRHQIWLVNVSCLPLSQPT